VYFMGRLSVVLLRTILSTQIRCVEKIRYFIVLLDFKGVTQTKKCEALNEIPRSLGCVKVMQRVLRM